MEYVRNQGNVHMARDEQSAKRMEDAALGCGSTVMPQGGAPDPWKHRSDGMRCKTCMWFNPKAPQPASWTESIKSYDVGRCRRHAPTMGGYPVVFVNDWCGDHRLDENRI